MLDELVQKVNDTRVCAYVNPLYLGILGFTMWMDLPLRLVFSELKGSEPMIKRGGDILFLRRVVVVQPSAIGAKKVECSTLRVV